MRTLIVILCLALGGCLTSGRRGGDTPPAVYDFGAFAAPAPAAGLPPLLVEVRAPSWFDGQAIAYRLAYAEPTRLREYALARWAGPPADLIEQRLMRVLSVVPAGQGSPRCLLRLHVQEFAQVFADAAHSHGLLEGRAVLLDHRRNPLAELPVRVERTAPTPDSRGGVAALSAAVGQMTENLDAWRADLHRAGVLGQCG